MIKSEANFIFGDPNESSMFTKRLQNPTTMSSVDLNEMPYEKMNPHQNLNMMEQGTSTFALLNKKAKNSRTKI